MWDKKERRKVKTKKLTNENLEPKVITFFINLHLLVSILFSWPFFFLLILDVSFNNVFN